MPSNEFDVIKRYFKNKSLSQNKKFSKNKITNNVLLGIGDDAAIIAAGNKTDYVLSVDNLVEGRHFFAGADAADLGHKSLAVALSDLAAMGAAPHSALLSLTMPQLSESWLEAFSANFYALANKFKLNIIGGNTSSGPLNIAVTVIGELAKDSALLRSNAEIGDAIFVVGNLGSAAAALYKIKNQQKFSQAEQKNILPALNRPWPLCEVGEFIIKYAKAAIDVSDGFLADLQHILTASGDLGADIFVDQLPIDKLLFENFSKQQVYDFILNGGEDYALCFTVAAENKTLLVDDWNYFKKNFNQGSELSNLELHLVGSVNNSSKINLYDVDNNIIHVQNAGWSHF